MGDLGSIPGLERPTGGGHGNPLQYSCLENPMDRGAWGATVHGVTKNWIAEGLITKHWLYSLYCTVYSCSLFILSIMVFTSLSPIPLSLYCPSPLPSLHGTPSLSSVSIFSIFCISVFSISFFVIFPSLLYFLGSTPK